MAGSESDLRYLISMLEGTCGVRFCVLALERFKVRYSAWTCWKQSHITFSDEWNVLDSKYTFYISLQY